MNKKIELKIVCQSCNGTGLYVGMAERDGAAVICTTCKGAGCQNYKFAYEDFVQRKARNGVVRVFKTSAGYIHSGKDANGVKFSQGGVSYDEWLKGQEPGPIKELYCPKQWTSQSWNSKTCDEHCHAGCYIPKCSYRSEMAKCWAEYDQKQAEEPVTRD